MTTIVADFRVNMMVSDSKASYGELSFKTKKIFRCDNGDLVGFSGECTNALKFVRWYMDGADTSSSPEWDDGIFDALVMTKNGLFLWDKSLIGMEVDEPFFSIGSGSVYALKAMQNGMSAVEAVEATTKIDPASGMPVRVEAYFPPYGAVHRV